MTFSLDEIVEAMFHMMSFDKLLQKFFTIIGKNEVGEGICIPDNWLDFFNIEFHCEKMLSETGHNEGMTTYTKPCQSS